MLESSPHQLRVYPSKRKFHARLSIKSERPPINSDEHIYDCKKLAANQKLKKGESEKKLEQLNRRFSSSSQNVRLKKNLSDSKGSLHEESKIIDESNAKKQL